MQERFSIHFYLVEAIFYHVENVILADSRNISIKLRALLKFIILLDRTVVCDYKFVIPHTFLGNFIN